MKRLDLLVGETYRLNATYGAHRLVKLLGFKQHRAYGFSSRGASKAQVETIGSDGRTMSVSPASFKEPVSGGAILHLQRQKETAHPVEIGICRYCGRSFATTPTVLVDHGFTISDGKGAYIGFRSGKCPCSRIQPWNDSPRNGEMLEAALEQFLAGKQSFLGRLRTGTLELQSDIYARRGNPPIIVKPGEPSYKRLLESRIYGTVRGIERITEDLAQLRDDLANWKPTEKKIEMRR